MKEKSSKYTLLRGLNKRMFGTSADYYGSYKSIFGLFTKKKKKKKINQSLLLNIL